MLASLRFAVVLAAGLVTAATIGKLVPHIPWLASTFDTSLGLAGLLVSAVMVPGALVGWVLGGVVDRFGAKRVAIGGIGLHAAASFCLPYATSFGTLAALRVIEGIGYSLLIVGATVLVVGVSAARRRALALSVWSSFAPIGFALGQWAAAGVGGGDRLAEIGHVHAALLAGAAVALALLFPPDAPARGTAVSRPVRSALSYPPALRAAGAFGCATAVLLSAVALTPLVLAPAAGLSVAETARLTALAALPGIIGRFGSGWLLDRALAPLAVFASASVIGTASLVGCLLAPIPLALALVFFACFQICIGALPGVLSAMLPHVAPTPAQLGTVTGMSNQTANLGNLIGPPLVLSVFAAAGPGAASMVLVAAVALGLAAIGNVAVFRAARV
ncbi:MAG TPA: MFS transporter [Burkholderiales bacterium]|nr:MFS transporter [Burkholderiales bacterium]